MDFTNYRLDDNLSTEDVLRVARDILYAFKRETKEFLSNFHVDIYRELDIPTDFYIDGTRTHLDDGEVYNLNHEKFLEYVSEYLPELYSAVTSGRVTISDYLNSRQDPECKLSYNFIQLGKDTIEIPMDVYSFDIHKMARNNNDDVIKIKFSHEYKANDKFRPDRYMNNHVYDFLDNYQLEKCLDSEQLYKLPEYNQSNIHSDDASQNTLTNTLMGSMSYYDKYYTTLSKETEEYLYKYMMGIIKEKNLPIKSLTVNCLAENIVINYS